MIEGSIFTRNNIVYGQGGAIYCSGTLQVNNTMFIDSRAYNRHNYIQNGGALYMAWGENASIVQSQFFST